MPVNAPTLSSAADVVEQLAASVIAQQLRLNQEFLHRIQSYRPIHRALSEHGLQGLADTLTPRQVVAREVAIETRFHFSRESERGFGVGIRLLNLGYSRKYQYSEFAEQTISLKVLRVPLEPADDQTDEKKAKNK